MEVFISIIKWGNFGNQLIQYMAALALQARIPNCKICNFSLPIYEIDEQTTVPSDCQAIYVENSGDYDLQYIGDRAKKSKLNVILDYHMQDMRFLLDPSVYRSKFPLSRSAPVFGDEYILINIRAGDILNGEFPWYPLIPIEFYKDVVSKSNRRPVFIGQLEPSEYQQRLRSAFSDAVFLESEGPESDFEIIRLAKNIVVSVSTFSWAAAWLSDAFNIYLPLTGWLNPAHLRDINLIPILDPRYHFFLFPMNYGLPEKYSFAHHRKMEASWKLISPSYLSYIITAAPFLPQPTRKTDVHEQWYVHQYLDAAMEISEGVYKDANHHYLDVGRRRGYKPRPPLIIPDMAGYKLISKGAATDQSSTSVWSKGRTTTADSAGALNGDLDQDYGFHTALEKEPWWMIDLGSTYPLRAILIYNRDGEFHVQERAFPLKVELKAGGEKWSVIATFQDSSWGKGTVTTEPLQWRTELGIHARFLKITSIRPGETFLHLRQVEVYTDIDP